MKKKSFLKRKNLIKTYVIVVIVALSLISSSSMSATLNKISNTKNSYLEAIEKETSKKFEPSTGLAPNIAVENPNIPIVSLPFEIMWGYIAYSSVFDEGTCYFDVENPEDITYLQDTESDDFLSGGTGYEGWWIACEFSNGALWEIDPVTGDMTYIGGGGVGLNGLATDHTTNNVYGASGSDLYLVDPEDGSQELIGSFGNGINLMIAIAFHEDGVLYGWDLGDNLWIINTETGQATLVGPLGIDISYAQDGDYDPETGTLYLTAFTLSPYYGSYLYTCDMETGQCTLVGALGNGYTEIDASVIYFGWCGPNHDVGVKDIISPNNGYANQDMEVIVKVKNHGLNSEENVPVNVVILKDGIDEEYNETMYVDIGYGETVDVEMPPWTPSDWQSVSNEYIDYKITAHTDLYGDINPDNDYKEKWFELYFGYFHDIGCTNVIRPESGPAQTFPVNVTIKNLGQYDECCFKTYVEIAEIDIENQVELLSQNFSDYLWPPDGWTINNSKWQLVNSSHAGGAIPEARFQWNPAETGLFRLYTPAIDTGDYSAVEIEFKHSISHYSGPYTLKVETSSDGVSWSTVWEIVNPSSQGSKTESIVTNANVGSDNFYISWTFEGNSYNINYWNVDDIVIKGYTSFDPEYEDYRCTTTIEPGEELKLEFDDWTPAYLPEETSGTKMYSVKAWTDLNDPQDENPDNDLFEKTIELDFFHDVGIKEIASPLLGSNKRFYAVDCYGYPSNSRFIWFDSDDPGTFYDIGPWPNSDFPEGGTFVKDVMWVCDTNGNIFKKKDPNSPEYEYVGNSITGELVDLAYHEKTKVLYGASGNNLYTINMETGHATLVGPFYQLGYYMMSIDCDRDGIMYGFDLNFDQGRIYTINLTTGKATCIGITGFPGWSEMEYDYDSRLMYVIVNKGQGWELYAGNFKTHEWTYKGTLYHQITCFAIPYSTPERYIPLGSQDIDVIVENIGTFPELDLTCYAEIYEYITNCTNGTLVYEDNITDIDLDEPLGGTKALNFSSYNFTAEGFYDLFLSIPDNDDDYLINNDVSLGIGADGTPPTSTHTLNPDTPNGDNGWYARDVTVTLNATDPSIGCEIPGSGVKEIKYMVNSVPGSVPGKTGIFNIHNDGANIEVKYWAVDNVGNTEAKHTFYINMDQTKPNVEPIEWDAYRKGLTWYVKFTCQADDATSGMDRVEMHINDELYETITNPGPTYEFNIEWSSEHKIAIFKFVAFDTAGNSAFKSVNGSVIKSNPSDQSSQQSSSISSNQKSINVFQTNGNPLEYNSACSYIMNVVDSSKELRTNGALAYGFCDDPYGLLNGYFVFDLNDPRNLTVIKPNVYCYSPGSFVPSHYFYFTQLSTGILGRLDLETFKIEIIGGGGNNLNGLAYNKLSNTMYGAGDTNLFSIDLDTGAQTVVGPFGGGILYMIGIAFSSDGTCYGWDLNDYLWTIDVTSGAATQVGPLGIDINWAVDGDFDKENDILYLAAYTPNPSQGYYLFECDEDTGECTLVDEFQNSAVVYTFFIPLNYSNKYPVAKLIWKPILPEPEETIFFNASECYDPDGYITLYEWDWNNDGIFDENHTSPTATHSWSSNGFYPVALRITDNSSINGTTIKRVRVGNQPPDIPTITGPTSGKACVKYQYNFSISDPDKDAMYLRVDWGNGTPGPWQGPYESDTTVRLNHSWNQKGNFTIRAQVKDIYGAESDWATLTVTIPRTRILINSRLIQMLERFPFLANLISLIK